MARFTATVSIKVNGTPIGGSPLMATFVVDEVQHLRQEADPFTTADSATPTALYAPTAITTHDIVAFVFRNADVLLKFSRDSDGEPTTAGLTMYDNSLFLVVGANAWNLATLFYHTTQSLPTWLFEGVDAG